MEIDFSELNRHLCVLSDFFAVRQTAPNKTTFIPQAPRPTDALLLFAGTKGICYETDREPFAVPQGALVYMPKGSHYIWENEPAKPDTAQEQYLFEFSLHDLPFTRDTTEKRAFFPAVSSGERLSFGKNVRIVTTRHSDLYKNLFADIVTAYAESDRAPFAAYCAAMTLLSTLSQNLLSEQSSAADPETLRRIRESAATLTGAQKGRTVAEIAAGCHISVSYYERLFTELFGMTPTAYRMTFRTSRIKKLLQDEASLEEIAQSIGFCDSGYLCRFFKRQTGMTPAEYRALYRGWQSSAVDN